MQGDQFRQLFCAGGAPSGPKVEEEKFAMKGGGIEGQARGEILERELGGELKRRGSGTAGGEEKKKRQKKMKTRGSHEKE